MSKILVTGGAGFIGTNLIIELIKNNHQITSIDNYSIGKRENHQIGVNYINGDVNNIKELVNNDFDICFHLAGLSRIQPSFINPEETFQSNAAGVLKILEWARINRTKVIYSGSSSFHKNPVLSPYAMFKYLGEEICKLYRASFGLNVEIVRFYNVYGPFEIKSGKWAAVIGLWRNISEKGGIIEIVGDGEQRRDFTHVDDIVDGLLKIGFSKQTHNDAWELGSGENLSLNQVYNLFKLKFGAEKKYIKDQPGNYRETIRKNDDALKRLQWKPKKKLEDYIKK